MYLHKITINNGNLCLGKSVRYFTYLQMDDKSHTSVQGRCYKKEDLEDPTYDFLAPYGSHYINYEGSRFLIEIRKNDKFSDELVHQEVYPIEVDIILLETPEHKINFESPPCEVSNLKKIHYETFHKISKNYLDKAKDHYDKYILETKDDDKKVIVHMWDDYWELLNKHSPRSINTIHLNGDDRKMLDYINKFKMKETKDKYKKRGIPYKLNILLEGFPGTGKTSLIFVIASELKCNLAFVNFNKETDDVSFMRALRNIPKNAILVLEDIDGLFKQRKEGDVFKSNISFSGLLNSLDGLAYREGMITFMTTNYLCNLDSALIRPGRIDNSLNFGLATEEQTKHMFNNFYEDKVEEFNTFYKKIKRCNFTTALLQDLFMSCMDDYEKLISDEVISKFKENCSKHSYDKKLDLYS